jgi:radical SAM protein with 4Fe4S-binding SPASM domain
MNCIFCRAKAKSISYKNELTTKECFEFLDDVSKHFKPIMVLTGGDPMEREDLFQIAEYGSGLGLYISLTSCGHSYTEENLQRIKDAGILRVTISLNGAIKETHDEISGRDGSFNEVMRAFELLRKFDISFHVNTTVVQRNLKEVPLILELAKNVGASGFFPFFLVPVGRGSDAINQAVPVEEYEKLLSWIDEQRFKLDMQYEKEDYSFLTNFFLRPSCAPQFKRIVLQKKEKLKNFQKKDSGFEDPFKGCGGGKTFTFITHKGKVQPCGMFEIECGDIREKPFSKIWEESIVFQELRDMDRYKGKCGKCRYLQICGGCRARPYIMAGDYLAEDPYCLYQPVKSSEDI